VRRIRWTTFVVLIALASVLACSDKSDGPTNPPAPLPADITLQFVTGGFTSPVFMTQPPGDNSRMFVVQKTGEIMVVKNGNTLTTPFLDITGLLSTGDYEQGLLSMAFRPDYGSSGRFYVCYTGADGDVTVARYHVSPGNSDVASPTADEIVLRVEHSTYGNHNGGLILFGPDGKLYVGIGDGGSTGIDPFQSGQDPSDSLGNILRIDVSGTSGYTIPGDNPYAGSPVWSWGLRNPWRFSFDRATGDLYIGDVGYGDNEEIDVATAILGGGKNVNFGWPVYEGTLCLNAPCSPTGKTMPAHDYVHTGDAYCVIGGYVYRGNAIAGLAGHYFYGDYGGTWLRSFKYSGGAATEHTLWNVGLPDPPLSFAEDNQGELYVLTRGGGIFRISP
jgi:glucose/arabinose dehydrogenase